jgi:hypothetical protein
MRLFKLSLMNQLNKKFMKCFQVIFFLAIFNITQAQYKFNSESVNKCLQEIHFFCKTDSILPYNNIEPNLSNDTIFINYLLHADYFTKKSLNKIRKRYKKFSKKDDYNYIIDNDTILHCIKSIWTDHFEVSFFCKTYKGKIFNKGVAINQILTNLCYDYNMGRPQGVSFFTKKTLESFVLLTRDFDAYCINCESLRIGNFDRLADQYLAAIRAKSGNK